MIASQAIQLHTFLVREYCAKGAKNDLSFVKCTEALAIAWTIYCIKIGNANGSSIFKRMDYENATAFYVDCAQLKNHLID